MGKKILAALASRCGILILTLLITILTIAILGKQFMDEARQGSILLNLQALALEDDLSLIFVAYGVFLEERSLLLSRALGALADTRLEETRNEDAETIGAYLLMIGLFLEVIDQVFDLILEYSSMAGQGLSLAVGLLNILSLFLLIRLVKRILINWSAPKPA